MSKEKSFIIIKEIEQPNGKVLPVVLLDSQSVVWEFDLNNDQGGAFRVYQYSDDYVQNIVDAQDWTIEHRTLNIQQGIMKLR